MSNLKQKDRPVIQEYTDYLPFQKDLYEYLKKQRKGFSLRTMNVSKEDAGEGNYSPQFLHMVLTGKKEIPETMIDSWCQALTLSKSECLFFRRLLRYGRADSPDDQVEAFQQMARRSEFRESHELGSRERLDFITHGFIGDVFLLTALPDFCIDYEWVSTRLRQKISRSELSTALDVLQDLDLIILNADGSVQRGPGKRPEPSSGEQALFRFFHMEQSEKARNALAVLDKEQRGFMTWGISGFTEDGFRNFARELAAEMDAVVERLAAKWESEEGDLVAQVNLQSFPVSHPKRQEKGEKS